MAEYSTRIVKAIRKYLSDDDWKFSFNEDRGAFEFGLSIKSSIKNLKYTILVRQSFFTVYATSPIGPSPKDEDKMQDMAEFLHRANYGLNMGNFEFDFRDGEIRYKSYIRCGDDVPDAEAIRLSILMPSAMMERYGDGITQILYGSYKSIESLIEKCEDQ